MNLDRVEKLPREIVSGGQTGVDRAALEAAIELKYPHGGWCPKGRLAEDGVIPHKFLLQETTSAEYPVRTRKNVLDSDGTLILYRQTMHGGTALTRFFVEQAKKPFLPIDLESNPKPDQVVEWICRYEIARLNVAGPRESSSPGISQQAREFLTRVLT